MKMSHLLLPVYPSLRAVIIPVLDPNPDSELRQFLFISQFQTPVHKDPIPLMDTNPGLQRIISCSRLVQIHLDIRELYYKIFFNGTWELICLLY